MIRIDDALFKAPGIMLGNKLFIYTLCRLLAEETGYDLQTDPVRLVRSDSKEADRIIKFDDHPGKMVTDVVHKFDDGAFIGKTIKQFADTILEKNVGAISTGYYARYELLQPYKDKVKSMHQGLFSNHELRNEDEVLIMLRDSRIDTTFKIPSDFYLSTLEQIKFNKLYIACDAPSRHTFLLNKLKHYNPVLLGGDALEQMNYVINFRTIIASQGTFSFWATFLSKADKIYWPVTTIGPNQRKDPMVNLFVDDEDRYIKIPVNNSRSTSISCGDAYETN